MSGKKHRQKGNRVERQIVDAHKAIGIHAERYPLSGASRFRGSGHDLDIYYRGRNEAPLVAEVKARKNGAGFTTLETWLGEYDALFLKRNNAEPLVVLPWRIWKAFIVRDMMRANLAMKAEYWWSEERHKVELAEQRDRVIEECARVALEYENFVSADYDDPAVVIAAAIRALKLTTS